MTTHKFIRPSGREIEVNDDSKQACLDKGWKLVEDNPKTKRTRKAKSDGNSTNAD